MPTIVIVIIFLAVLGFALWLFLSSRGDGLAARIIDWVGSLFGC